MKNRRRLLFEVTLWEFSRWFKLKDQIISLLIISLISLLIFGGKAFFNSKKSKSIQIAVINNELLPSNLNLDKKFILKPENEGEKDALFRLLYEEKLEGILIISSKNSAELHVNDNSEWINEIKGALNSALQNVKLKEMNLTKEQLDQLFREYELNIHSQISISKAQVQGRK